MMYSCVIPQIRWGSFYLQTVNLQTTGVRKKLRFNVWAFVLHPQWSKLKHAATNVFVLCKSGGSSKTAVRGVEGKQLCFLGS